MHEPTYQFPYEEQHDAHVRDWHKTFVTAEWAAERQARYLEQRAYQQAVYEYLFPLAKYGDEGGPRERQLDTSTRTSPGVILPSPENSVEYAISVFDMDPKEPTK